MEEWVLNLNPDDLCLDEKNVELLGILGLDKYMEFVRAYGGTRIYVNKFSEVIKKARDKNICKEYNGYNLRQLSIKYNLATDSIRRLINENEQEKK